MGVAGDPAPGGRSQRVEAHLEDLFRAHREELYRLAVRVVRSSDDADDVIHTVFLRLLSRHTQDLRITRGYLHRAIWNAALDFRRDEAYRRNARMSWSANRETHGNAMMDVEKSFDRDRIVQTVAVQLERLPESQRETLELVDLQGATYEEAAEKLGISVEAVRKRLYRGRQHLRAQFEEREIESLDDVRG